MVPNWLALIGRARASERRRSLSALSSILFDLLECDHLIGALGSMFLVFANFSFCFFLIPFLSYCYLYCIGLLHVVCFVYPLVTHSLSAWNIDRLFGPHFSSLLMSSIH